MVVGLEFEGSKLHCGPHEVRLRAASAMLFSTPSLAILVPKPQLVPPLGSFLSAASRSRKRGRREWGRCRILGTGAMQCYATPRAKLSGECALLFEQPLPLGHAAGSQ